MSTAGGRVPYAVAARELLRTSLLDAAGELLRDRPWSEVPMADVAAAAGVSRQTLYAQFGSRDDFAQAYVLREAERFLVAVEEALAGHLDDPARALAAAFDVFLTAAADDPFVRAVVFDSGAHGLLPLVTTQGRPLVEAAAERLAAMMVADWPQIALSDAHLLAECLVRLAISYAALPSGPASMTAESIATLLGPHLERLTAG